MNIPEKVGAMLDRWRSFALATTDPDGTPNVAPMMQMWRIEDDVIVIADLFMKRTRENIQANGKAGIGIWDDETRESYKLKGEARYVTEGKEFDFAVARVREKKPKANPKGALVIRILSVHDTASGPHAGDLLWPAE